MSVTMMLPGTVPFEPRRLVAATLVALFLLGVAASCDGNKPRGGGGHTVQSDATFMDAVEGDPDAFMRSLKRRNRKGDK